MMMGPAKYAVLMMLYAYRNKTGHAFPSIKTLAVLAGVHRNTASRAVGWAVKYLGVKKRPRRQGWLFYLPLKLTARQMSRIQIEAGMIDLDMGSVHIARCISSEKSPTLQSRNGKKWGSQYG